jgi:hypothetical protein
MSGHTQAVHRRSITSMRSSHQSPRSIHPRFLTDEEYLLIARTTPSISKFSLEISTSNGIKTRGHSAHPLNATGCEQYSQGKQNAQNHDLGLLVSSGGVSSTPSPTLSHLPSAYGKDSANALAHARAASPFPSHSDPILHQLRDRTVASHHKPSDDRKPRGRA